MNIAIIGAGNVGSTLGRCWSRNGHKVVFGSRNPANPQVREMVVDCGRNASATTRAEAVKEADVVLLATPWSGTLEALQDLPDLSGKILLDATNPLKEDMSGLIEVRSGGEVVAEKARNARVVKIFNTTGTKNMCCPSYGRESLTMFYCGDDAEAKAVAHKLAAEVGFDPIDIGPLSQSSILEQLALLWVTLAYKQGLGTDFAIQLIKRPARIAATVR